MRLAHTLLAALLSAGTVAAASDCPSSVTLQDTTSNFPALGLVLRLPVGARIESSAIGEAHQSFAVRPADGTWRIDVSENRIGDVTVDAQQAATNLAATLLRTNRRIDGRTGQMVGSEVEILQQPASLDLAGAPASRFYASVPIATPKGETRVVEGYTVVSTSPGVLLVFKLQCLPQERPCAQDAYESILDTAQVRDPGEASAERAAAVRSGEGVIDSLTLEDYRAVLDEGARWFRLYRPSPTGASQDASEIAYQAVEARIGKRSEMAKIDGGTNAGDSEGLLVKVIARYLDGRRLVDTESTFFQTITDGRLEGDETWTIRMVVRDGADNVVWTETGVRDDRRLTVRVVAPGQPATQKSWIPPEEGYLSQAQALILPRLLVRNGAPIVVSFYTYNSALSELALRRDVLEPAPAGSEGWILTTNVGEGSDRRRTVLTRDGRIVRAELRDGAVLEPTEPDRIRSIWKSKGLSTN